MPVTAWSPMYGQRSRSGLSVAAGMLISQSRGSRSTGVGAGVAGRPHRSLPDRSEPDHQLNPRSRRPGPARRRRAPPRRPRRASRSSPPRFAAPQLRTVARFSRGGESGGADKMRPSPPSPSPPPTRRPPRIEIQKVGPSSTAAATRPKRSVGDQRGACRRRVRRRPRVFAPPCAIVRRVRRRGARRRWCRSATTAGTERSRSAGSGAGSTRSRPGSTAMPPGAMSWSGRSRPGRPTSTASSPKARRCSACSGSSWRRRSTRFPSAGLPREAEMSLDAAARADRRSRAGDASAPGTSSSRARSAVSPVSSGRCPSWPSSDSTSSTCRRSTRSAAPIARAATTRSCAEPDDPGSPWAIGGPEGGHTAVAPGARDVRRVRAAGRRAAGHGIEIALDLALQCSPDHPWLAEHPEWFQRRPDGTLKYAENPPKRYQDIYNLNFESEDWRGSGRRCGTSSLCWAAKASGSSASTTRTRSRSRSGSG